MRKKHLLMHPNQLESLIAENLFRNYILKYSPPETANRSGSQGGGGAFSGLTGASIAGHTNRVAGHNPSQDPLDALMASAKATVQQNRRHPLLEEVNPNSNLQKKIDSLSVLINLDDEDKSRLKNLLQQYFELERLVHRIKRGYITEGKLKLLNKSGWTVFSHTLLNTILRNVPSSEDIDFLSGLGEGGGGLSTAIDNFFKSQEMVSFTLEAFNNFNATIGTGFEETGIAIVYSKETKENTSMIAVNVPDLIYLFPMFVRPWLNAAEEEHLRREVLLADGLNKLREETLLRQGMNSTLLQGSTYYNQTALTPREVMKPDGILSESIETVVVADDIFPMVKSMATYWKIKDKIVSAKDYFKETGNSEFTNERIRKAENIKKEILNILQQASSNKPVKDQEIVLHSDEDSTHGEDVSAVRILLEEQKGTWKLDNGQLIFPDGSSIENQKTHRADLFFPELHTEFYSNIFKIEGDKGIDWIKKKIREWEQEKYKSSHSSSGIKSPGGIDLDTTGLNLDIRGQSQSSPITINNIPFDLKSFQGFTFQIIRFDRNKNAGSAPHPSSKRELSRLN